MVARVGTDRKGNTEPGVLGDALQHVVLRGDGRGIRGEPRDHVGDFCAIDELAVGRGVVLGTHPHAAGRTLAAHRAVHHGPGLLFERHPRHEIARPLVRGEAPILIRIEHPVPVQILELQPVLVQHRRLQGQQQHGQEDRRAPVKERGF